MILTNFNLIIHRDRLARFLIDGKIVKLNFHSLQHIKQVNFSLALREISIYLFMSDEIPRFFVASMKSKSRDKMPVARERLNRHNQLTL